VPVPTGEHAAEANRTVWQQRCSEKVTKQLAIWAVLALVGMAAWCDSNGCALRPLGRYPIPRKFNAQ
jgi:hypothetical protein